MSPPLDQIVLTPEQKQQVVWLAERTGMPWDEVLGKALAAYRPLVETGDDHLSAMLRELAELQQEPERDDFGLLRPTPYAFETAIRLLANAAILASREGGSLPKGCVSTDSLGGVRIEWIRPTKSVHLAVPANADENGYVYREHGDAYSTEKMTSEQLVRCLREIA